MMFHVKNDPFPGVGRGRFCTARYRDANLAEMYFRTSVRLNLAKTGATVSMIEVVLPGNNRLRFTQLFPRALYIPRDRKSFAANHKVSRTAVRE